MNGLKQLYVKLPVSKRSKIREDLEAMGQKYHRLNYWINKKDADFLQMPTVLKEIVCANIPAAKHLFKMPDLNDGAQLKIKY